MKPAALIGLILTLLTLPACHNLQEEKAVSVKNNHNVPYDLFWKVMQDSLNFSLAKRKNDYISLDTINDFKIIKKHFITKDKDELVLQRSFINRRFENNFDVACLFSFENNTWKFHRLIIEDTISYIDIDKDSIYELFCSQDWIGNGSVDTEKRLISLKDNKKRVLFERYNSDNRNNMGAFTISKVGDTIFDVAEYNFAISTPGKPLELKETRTIGIKKGFSISKKKERLFIDYSVIKRTYRFDGNQYK